jgi:hypothetical protein
MLTSAQVFLRLQVSLKYPDNIGGREREVAMLGFRLTARRVRAMPRLLCSTASRQVIRAIVPASLVLAVPVQFAVAITYVFDQTSASVPGLIVTGQMTINGGFADLPTLSNFCHAPCGPVDYGNLLGIEISANFTGQFTRLNLTQSPDPTAYPQWDIAPDRSPDPGIRSSDGHIDLFDFGWEDATIQTDTDDGPFPDPCEESGVCRVTGHWIAIGVPEGSSLMLLASALLGFCAIRRGARVRPERD